MIDDVQKLRETLASLHAELGAVESQDPEVRRLLVDALRDIADKLQARDGDPVAVVADLPETSTSAGQLAESARILEVEHPTLAATLRGVVEALTRMGI